MSQIELLTFDPVVIECGKTTCASKPGKFCQYFKNNLKGGGTCYFFGQVWDKDGWIQRHEECIKHSTVISEKTK